MQLVPNLHDKAHTVNINVVSLNLILYVILYRVHHEELRLSPEHQGVHSEE